MSSLLLSLFCYILFAIILFLLGYNSSTFSDNTYLQTDCYEERFDKYMIYSVLFFVLIVSIRYRVGADCESYSGSLAAFSRGIYSQGRAQAMEPLAILFGRFVNFLSAGRVLLLGLYGFCEIFFIYVALRSRKKILPYLGSLLILGPLWFDLNNGLRQITVSCLLLYCIQQLIDYNKWRTFILLIFIGSLMHKSALMLLPLVFLISYNKLPNRWLMLSLLCLCVVLGRLGVINDYLLQLDGYIKMFGYTEYSERLQNLIESDSLVSNYGPRRIVILLSHFIFIIFSKDVDEFVKHDKFFRVCVLMSFVYACFSELLLGSFFIFSRPLEYIHIFTVVLHSYVLYYLFFSKKYMLYVCSLIICLSYVIIECCAVYTKPNEYSLYKTIFFN